MKIAILVLLLVAFGFLLYVRLAGHNPATWHVDPSTAAKPRKKNFFFIREGERQAPKVYPLSPRELAGAFDAVAMASPGTERLAGSPDEAWVTYVTRTKLLRYPDYISVRFQAVDGGAELVLFSRARFGYSDRGVNRRRALDWLGQMESRMPVPEG